MGRWAQSQSVRGGKPLVSAGLFHGKDGKNHAGVGPGGVEQPVHSRKDGGGACQAEQRPAVFGPLEDQHKDHGHRHGAESNGRLGAFGQGEKGKGQKIGDPPRRLHGEFLPGDQGEQSQKGREKHKGRGLGVDVGGQVAQQGVAENAVAGGPGFPHRGGLEAEQQNGQHRCLFLMPLIEHQAQGVEGGQLGQQKQRPRKEGEHIITGDPGGGGQGGGQQLGQVVVGKPYPGKPDVLRREGVAKGLGIADVPQKVLVQHHTACRQRVGVAGTEREGKKDAEHAPEHRQQRQSGGPGGKFGAAEEGGGIPGGSAPFPQSQYQHGKGRTQAEEPSRPQTDGGTEQNHGQGAAVHRRQKRGKAGGTGPEPPGQQPAGQNEIEGRSQEKTHRPEQGSPRQGDDGQVDHETGPGQDPGQRCGDTGAAGGRGGRAFKDRDGGGHGGGPPVIIRMRERAEQKVRKEPENRSLP